MSKQFKHTTQERRSSIIYSNNNGKGGLFSPQDYISGDKTQAFIDDDISEDSEDSLFATNNSRTLQHEYGSTGRTGSSDSSEIHSALPKNLIREERDLLMDNKLYNSNHALHNHAAYSTNDPNSSFAPTSSIEDQEVIETWEDAIESGKDINTTFKREAIVITSNASPLVLTFILQNSLSLASIFSVSHLGSNELGAVTLGSMTASITGFAAIQGLCTCLDTLCAQAYGGNHYHLVGVLFQRCAIITIILSLPVLFTWWQWSEQILALFIPERELCALAAKYLQIVSLGIPAFILFECGKRFLQCQGIFHASSIVLLVCAPLNALMNYVLVWDKNIGIGYLGAPISVVLNYWLMALGLFAYTLYTKNEKNPMKCWNGFIKPHQILKNSRKMFNLALPGIIMVEAEFLGFEILTIFASHLGTHELAAQSIISTIASLAYQVPFSISISTSTRVANFIGASLYRSCVITCKVSLLLSFIISSLNMAMIYKARYLIARLFSSEPDVVRLVSSSLPILAFMQIFDAFNASTAGCLRGQGQQKIGGYINVFAFYCIGIPVSYLLTFHYGFGVSGLWWGITSGLVFMSIFQSYAVFHCNWNDIIRAAKSRNSEGAMV
ncbi:MATE family efflux transporter [Kluyveromyces lactis]|uniref:KLLA0F21802p n=1 Tax=Kluyveromyces lactis (strain ATCC 8585 / CBS 2359 / DSM 70799 / NBRC 1267 / NRRL Y-1140 / WM37) TaxID=284590 RepID=Q6CJ36_KLULA|nr:uncharacterized protein KLLA0_F21802g [Kluyveromyces lactis]CAG98761.1 KLLA0F21802p [Kluyveromyces lactis]|eukprot:XP_456053.1 uncharacterized protein KLLA0_F21802g [Kluyveromyces lactis]